MISDDERREVAESLRYAADCPGRPIKYMEQFVDELREDVFSDVLPGADYDEILRRLADLIEPSTSATPTPLRRVTDASATVEVSQRDALLALADECDFVCMHNVARRIREAMGVQDA